MKTLQKITAKANDHFNHEGVTIAFLGDSVTQGCFEIYKKENNEIETFFDKRHSYERYFLIFYVCFSRMLQLTSSMPV